MLAKGLREWARDEDTEDAEVGSLVLAETILLLRATLIGLSKKR